MIENRERILQDGDGCWEKQTVEYVVNNLGRIRAILKRDPRYSDVGVEEIDDIIQDLLIYFYSTNDYNSELSEMSLASYVSYALKIVTMRRNNRKTVSTIHNHMYVDGGEILISDLYPNGVNYIPEIPFVPNIGGLKFKYLKDVALWGVIKAKFPSYHKEICDVLGLSVSEEDMMRLERDDEFLDLVSYLANDGDINLLEIHGLDIVLSIA
jgi:hypothetical protein